MPRNDLKAYTSVIARLPQELADQVKHYASEHGCSVSDLIRAGLELRLAADIPARTPDRSSDSEVLQEVLHTINALDHLLRTQIEDTVRTALPEVLHEVLQGHAEVLQRGKVLQGYTSAPESLAATSSGGMTEVVPLIEGIQGHTSAALQKGNTSVLPHRDEVLQGYTEEGSTEVVPYDTIKYRLGKLCPRSHDYHGTGQSLRTNNKAGYCLACNAADVRARRQAKRQEVSA